MEPHRRQTERSCCAEPCHSRIVRDRCHDWHRSVPVLVVLRFVAMRRCRWVPRARTFASAHHRVTRCIPLCRWDGNDCRFFARNPTAREWLGETMQRPRANEPSFPHPSVTHMATAVFCAHRSSTQQTSRESPRAYLPASVLAPTSLASSATDMVVGKSSSHRCRW